jgi:hypothetical protein
MRGGGEAGGAGVLVVIGAAVVVTRTPHMTGWSYYVNIWHNNSGHTHVGIESRLGRAFPYMSRPALGTTQSPIQWVQGLSRGAKRPRRGVDHPPPSSTEVKERVKPYLYSPYGPSWPVLGWTLALLYSCDSALLWPSQTTMGLLRHIKMALYISRMRANNNPYAAHVRRKENCSITVYTHLYLCAKQLHVSAVYSHHQTEHRTASKDAIKL